MTPALLATKVGMTRLYDKDGKNVPATVLEAGPCVVTAVRGEDDGYHAVQLGFGDVKPKHSTLPMIGHAAKAGTSPKRYFGEVRLKDAADKNVGDVIKVDVFEGIINVDVVGISKGKGTAGVMKRHNFGGQPASHGTERKHRSPGSIGGRATNRGFNGRPKKGLRMAGRMGNERITSRNHQILGYDVEKNLLFVKGCVPGGKNGLVHLSASMKQPAVSDD